MTLMKSNPLSLLLLLLLFSLSFQPSPSHCQNSEAIASEDIGYDSLVFAKPEGVELDSFGFAEPGRLGLDDDTTDHYSFLDDIPEAQPPTAFAEPGGIGPDDTTDHYTFLNPDSEESIFGAGFNIDNALGPDPDYGLGDDTAPAAAPGMGAANNFEYDGDDDLNTICAKTDEHADLCLSMARSGATGPIKGPADVLSLGLQALVDATKKATENKASVDHAACKENAYGLESAMNDLQYAQTSLANGNNGALVSAISALFSDYAGCGEGDLKNLASICMAISAKYFSAN